MSTNSLFKLTLLNPSLNSSPPAISSPSTIGNGSYFMPLNINVDFNCTTWNLPSQKPLFQNPLSNEIMLRVRRSIRFIQSIITVFRTPGHSLPRTVEHISKDINTCTCVENVSYVRSLHLTMAVRIIQVFMRLSWQMGSAH